MAITVSATGYIKRTAITEYRSQRRGGRGRIGMRTREEDFVNHLFVASTHSYVLIFSDRGRCYWLKVHEIPDVAVDGKGKAIANLVSMQPDEKIAALLTVRELDTPERYIVMCTRRGTVKKTELASFSNPRAGGIIAIGVDDDDAVMAVQVSDGKSEIFIGTRNGMAIRFSEEDIRPMGRTAYGVRGIALRDDDEVVGMEVLRPGGAILTVTENGYGKRTEIDEYRRQGRGGYGIINIQTSERNGRVVGVSCVVEQEELMFITEQGMILRTRASGISVIGRATQGVRLIDMDEGDHAVSVARLGGRGLARGGRPGRRRGAETRAQSGIDGRRPPAGRRSYPKEADMHRRRITTYALLASFFALALTVTFGCSVSPEKKILQDFFRASRLRDDIALGNFATTTFDPNTDGIVQSFEVVSMGEEKTAPLPLKDYAKAADEAKAAEAEFRLKKLEYQKANLPAIERVIAATDAGKAVAPRDRAVQAAWDQWVADFAKRTKAASDAQRQLSDARGIPELSLSRPNGPTVDATKFDGVMISKEIVINASVRDPSGQTVERNLVAVLQRPQVKDENGEDLLGRWIVTSVKPS